MCTKTSTEAKCAEPSTPPSAGSIQQYRYFISEGKQACIVMANPSDVAKTDGFLRFGTRIYNFRVPLCKQSVDYQAALKSSIGAPETASFVTSLAQARLDMINTLYSTAGAYEQKIKAIEAYMLLVFKLHDAFGAQKIQLDKELSFEWRGSVTDKPDFFRSSDVLFELLLVLHSKAMYHSIAARSLLDTDPVTFLSDAAKHLLEASSIMSYMGTNIGSGAWSKGFNRRCANPPEVTEHMCLALAAMFKGQAQALSFMKAATGGSTPANIRARLAVGVTNSIVTAIEQLSLVPDCTLAHADLLTHMHVTKQFYYALAYQYAAVAFAEKSEVGNAIAFCQHAKALLQPQKSASKPVWSAPGMPKQVGQYADIGPAVAYVTDALSQTQSDAERDNKFVHFQPVPGPYSSNSSSPLPLPELPPEASVMNPGPFREPDRAPDPALVFEYKAKPSIFSSMFSGLVSAATSAGSGSAAPAGESAAAGKASGEAPSAPSAPSAPPMSSGGAVSDEELALSLQRQYDAETKSPQQLGTAGGASGAPPPPLPPLAPPAAPQYNSLV